MTPLHNRAQPAQYALSPVAGLAADRFGNRAVTYTGILLLLAACTVIPVIVAMLRTR